MASASWQAASLAASTPASEPLSSCSRRRASAGSSAVCARCCSCREERVTSMARGAAAATVCMKARTSDWQ